MQQQLNQSLVRKQYLVTDANIKKVEALAKDRGTSATEIVRQAIDAYNPDELGDLAPEILMALVSERLQEAIESTQSANNKVSETLEKLEVN